MTKPINWWLTAYPLLKLLTMLCSLLTILFLMDGRVQWWPYTVIFLVCCLVTVVHILLLIVHYFDITQQAKNVDWLTFDIIWTACASVCFVLSSLLLGWDWWRMNNNQWQHHSRLPPANIGSDGWRGRVSVLMIMTAITGILFIVSLLRLRTHKFH